MRWCTSSWRGVLAHSCRLCSGVPQLACDVQIQVSCCSSAGVPLCIYIYAFVCTCMFSCVWCLIYWYWWCASGASVGWLVPNGHHHWAGRPRPCARTYNLEKSLSLSKHKHDNSKNSCRWVKRCDALRLDKCFCHRTASESDEADQSEDQRKVVTLTKYAELVFPGKVCKVCCGTRQKIYYNDKNILDIAH